MSVFPGDGLWCVSSVPGEGRSVCSGLCNLPHVARRPPRSCLCSTRMPLSLPWGDSTGWPEHQSPPDGLLWPSFAFPCPEALAIRRDLTLDRWALRTPSRRHLGPVSWLLSAALPHTHGDRKLACCPGPAECLRLRGGLCPVLLPASPCWLHMAFPTPVPATSRTETLGEHVKACVFCVEFSSQYGAPPAPRYPFVDIVESLGSGLAICVLQKLCVPRVLRQQRTERAYGAIPKLL